MRSLLLAGLSIFLVQCSSTTAYRTTSGKNVLDKSGYLYDPSDRSCDGFPRLQVDTMPGTCLGLVLPLAKAASTDKPWKMPRTLEAIPGTSDFLVTDMGGWAAKQGGLYWLRRKGDGQYENVLLKSGLNRVHSLRFGPGGFFYIGDTDFVARFHFSEGKMRDWEVVVDKLPRFKGHMHPLVSLAFDPRNGDMYINSGAPSDHCFVKKNGEYSSCPEDSEMGLAAIYRVPGAMLQKPIPKGGIPFYEIAASGLRNSMAMEVHPSGMLVQGENGRDFPELEEPYEELNAIDLDDTKRGEHYGWPYCFDFHGVSPEWKFSQNATDPLHARFNKPVDCFAKSSEGQGTYRAPHILMPPHSAPLHLAYYPESGQLSTLLKGKLLVGWHGYQPSGHRLVAYPVDERGLPVLLEQRTGKETYSFNTKGGCPVQKQYRPEGGLDRFAPYTEVISGWNDVKGVRPKGSPVGFKVASDGSIFLVEDKNRVVVRLAHSDQVMKSTCDEDDPSTIDPRIELLAWRSLHQNNPASRAAFEKMRDKLVKKYCADCHGGFQENEIGVDGYSELDYMVKNDFFVPRDSMASKMYQALAQTGEVPAMPPSDVEFPKGTEGAALVQLAKTWIDTLPGDIIDSVKKTSLTASRKIRSQPTAKGKECGQVGPGDVVYIDPQASYKADGWTWTKAYMLRGDSRLYKQACPYPMDGVFYIAVTKL